MLSDLPTVKTALGIPLSDTTQDSKLVQVLVAADRCVKNYCHREFETSPYILEYPQRGNEQALPLLQRPLRPVLATGTLTANSTTITNITVNPPYSAAQILSGMPVAVSGGASSAALLSAVPPFTTIGNLSPATSPTSCTMSNAATQSGTVPLIFGLDVYLDFRGNYGFGLNAYRNGPNNSSRLYAGLDYAPRIDQADGSSKSGLLMLLGQSGFGGSLWAFSPMGYGFGGFGGAGPYGGPLTQAMPPQWPNYPGALCVTYCAGVGNGGAAAPSATQPTGGVLDPNTTIPADLTAAVTAVAGWMWGAIDAGLMQTNSESFQGYSRGLAEAAKNGLEKAEALGSTREILSPYVEVVI